MYLLLLLVGWICQANGAVDLSEFYEAGDVCLLRQDDKGSASIAIPIPFYYFGNSYTQLFVGHNGIVSFDQLVTKFRSNAFPDVGRHVMISPFWTDIDIRYNGTICYRSITSGQELVKAQNEIRQYFPALTKFTPTWIFIVTWLNVLEYPSTSPEKNTFQAVLMAQEKRSFTIYNYNKIEWATDPQVGFNKGDLYNYYAVQGSRTSDMIHLPERSNVGIPGKFVFRINNEIIEDDPVNTGCDSRKVDVIFLLDSSYSEEATYERSKDYIDNFLSNVTIGKLQIGLVSFSNVAREEFSLNSYQNVDDIRKHLKRLQHMNKTTILDVGLTEALNLLSTYKGARIGSTKYIVVLSDGLVSERQRALTTANNLKLNSFKIICIGMGKSVNHEFLETIAFNSSFLLRPDPDTLLSLIEYENSDDPTCKVCSRNYHSNIFLLLDPLSSMTTIASKKTAVTFITHFLPSLADKMADNDSKINIRLGTMASNTIHTTEDVPLSAYKYVIDKVLQMNTNSKQTDSSDNLPFQESHLSSDFKESHSVIYVTGCVSDIQARLSHVRGSKATLYVVAVGCSDGDWVRMEKEFEAGYFLFDAANPQSFQRRFLTDITQFSCA